jgi:hypothetical protein
VVNKLSRTGFQDVAVQVNQLILGIDWQKANCVASIGQEPVVMLNLVVDIIVYEGKVAFAERYLLRHVKVLLKGDCEARLERWNVYEGNTRNPLPGVRSGQFIGGIRKEMRGRSSLSIQQDSVEIYWLFSKDAVQ